jgi:hypothetical protein
MQGVFSGQNMRVVSGVTSLTSTLHWAKEVVVKVFDMHDLVNHDVIDLASQGSS